MAESAEANARPLGEEQSEDKEQESKGKKGKKKPKFNPIEEMPHLYPEPDYVVRTRPPMWDDWRLNIFRGLKEKKLKKEAGKIARRKCWETGNAFSDCTQQVGLLRERRCKPFFNEFRACMLHEQNVEMDKLRRDVKRHSEWWWLCLYDEHGEIGRQAAWQPEAELSPSWFKSIAYNMFYKPLYPQGEEEKERRLQELRRK